MNVEISSILQNANSIGLILYLILPIILAGTLNMLFVKSRLFSRIHVPMDAGKCLSDGQPIFGANKTWKGFWGMIFFCALCFFVFGLIAQNNLTARELSLIPYESYNYSQLVLFGALWGLGYVLFELPNSFIKRRINIAPGKGGKKLSGIIFNFVDQADSALGCVIFLLIFYTPSFALWFSIFIVATAVHYLMNILLYVLRLKSSPW
ncbi:CDP-archaeol synthase [Pseudoalteromonas denitrificans]|jgi:CDP-diglyceride synthetase|uniref:Putative integral membrane protein DUF46 n=1 Tax=Pseudoalteromonas denitrificans DSM 6059 TaxID=1123010 RepID=A0A1I1QYC4_9GAMM|nr:CDP-archaeol synthase [Pseudoalteromonas denitrificans]SFD26987.1 Putative integral membrane protein DUF46 [Pseudoalteromonas denitrificans DSM 6059]